MLVILVMMVVLLERRGGVHPSVQISINQDGSLHSSSSQIRQMITSIQPTRAVDGEGPSCTAIRPSLASWRTPTQNHCVFLLLTNRLIKTMMIDTQRIKESCVSVGTNALNLHITNLKLRVFRSACPENTHHSFFHHFFFQSGSAPAEIISFPLWCKYSRPARTPQKKREGI